MRGGANEFGTEVRIHQKVVFILIVDADEVKRIFARLGNEVVGLARVEHAGYALDRDLEPGGWRELEFEALNVVTAPKTHPRVKVSVPIG